MPYVLNEAREELAVLNTLEATHRTLADVVLMQAKPRCVENWWRRHAEYVDDRAAVVLERAREYYEHRKKGEQRPADISPTVYDGLANWYAVNTRADAAPN